MPRRTLSLLSVLVAVVVAAGVSHAQGGPSGQVQFGQASVEPAYDDMTGDLIYLLTPIKSPDPVNSNPRAAAPMYIVVYPTTSSVWPLNCTPTNCDHLQSLPPPLLSALGLGSVYPGGVVKGHDHLVGVAKTGGDFNVAWHVYLVLFTPQGVSDGAINREIKTLQGINDAIAAHDAVGPIDIPPPAGPIVFHCSVTSAATYKQR